MQVALEECEVVDAGDVRVSQPTLARAVVAVRVYAWQQHSLWRGRQRRGRQRRGDSRLSAATALSGDRNPAELSFDV